MGRGRRRDWNGRQLSSRMKVGFKQVLLWRPAVAAAFGIVCA